MSDNSKQNDESFFSLMIQFSMIMLVFWIIISIFRPLLPEDTSDKEIDDDGKRNFQYACLYNNLEKEEVETEEIIISEISEVSYDVKSYINNMASEISKLIQHEFGIRIESNYILVKSYNFFSENEVQIIENENGDYILLISDGIKSKDDISEDYKYEILISVIELYKKQNTIFNTYENEDVFGEGIKRLVYENIANTYLEKNQDIIYYFLKQNVPELERDIFDESYKRFFDDFNANIEEVANTHIFYTSMDAFEYHLKRYFENGKSEEDLLCCLELVLISKSSCDLSENEKAYELLKTYISTEHWYYFKELIHE